MLYLPNSDGVMSVSELAHCPQQSHQICPRVGGINARLSGRREKAVNRFLSLRGGKEREHYSKRQISHYYSQEMISFQHGNPIILPFHKGVVFVDCRAVIMVLIREWFRRKGH